MMNACAAANRYHFHRDAMADYLDGGKINVYFHRGYGKRIMSTEAFFQCEYGYAFIGKQGRALPTERPVHENARDVSTYYAEGSSANN